MSRLATARHPAHGADRASERGVPVFDAELIVAHRQSIHGTYDRHRYQKKTRRAAEVEAKLTEIIERRPTMLWSCRARAG
jgi:hypothetical protein